MRQSKTKTYKTQQNNILKVKRGRRGRGGAYHYSFTICYRRPWKRKKVLFKNLLMADTQVLVQWYCVKY